MRLFRQYVIATLIAGAIAPASCRAQTVSQPDTVLADTAVAVIDSAFATAQPNVTPEQSMMCRKPMKRPHDDLYQHPYSMWRHCPNWPRLLENTGVLFAAGFATLGVLEILPDNTTAWNTAERKRVPFFKRWWNHVKVGPVWDSDLPLFNYILHPYAGGAYYMSARSQGFNVLGSFAYCAFISTVFWEYGIECFNEVPSIQDLIITPVGGMVLGEAFYLAKRRIVSEGYRLCGSPVLGNIVAVLIDPVNEVLGFIFGNSARQWIKYNRCHSGAKVESSWGPVSAGWSSGFGLNVTATF